MPVQTALEAAEPPHEANGDADLGKVCEGCEFYNELTCALLDRELGIDARRLEIECFNTFEARGVYTNCLQEIWIIGITTKCLDVNKGDAESPHI